MKQEIEDYLLQNFTQKKLDDRYKLEFIKDVMTKRKLSINQVAKQLGYSHSTLKTNLKTLDIPEDLYNEYKELGFTQQQIKKMHNPSKEDTEDRLNTILNKLIEVTNPNPEHERLIMLIEKQLSRIKHIMHGKMALK